MSSDAPVIVWFRRDLRLGDNPALYEARESGQPIIPVYIFETGREKPLGAATLWWLHHSLSAFEKSLEDIGLNLVILKGKSGVLLPKLAKDSGANAVYWNRRYEHDRVENDTELKSALEDEGISVHTYRANLLSEPWEVETKSGGGYYKVFTPYWKAAKDHFEVQPCAPKIQTADGYSGKVDSLSLSDLELLPTQPDWGSKMAPYWTPGEDGAHEQLNAFLRGPIEDYAAQRNRPDDENGTSKISPHLSFGEISPRQIWHAVKDNDYSSDKYLSEVGWREFSYVLLFHNPKLYTDNFREDFDAFPWEKNTDALERWQRGQTGYPFVDAGMRQLWETGWQHNRVRMVTASFLIKHLLTHWREGEKWFWDTLVDADPANNAASWQWVAGSGADAAPYFRIFNPFTQGEKFDPNGDYVRRWVPELKHLPNKFIHRPWDAPELVLKEADVELGKTYPKPIVEHSKARERALEAYQKTKG